MFDFFGAVVALEEEPPEFLPEPELPVFLPELPELLPELELPGWFAGVLELSGSSEHLPVCRCCRRRRQPDCPKNADLRPVRRKCCL